jgi:hypothetical protein
LILGIVGQDPSFSSPTSYLSMPLGFSSLLLLRYIR